MAKLLDFQTPTGQTGNLLKVSSWTSMILGSFVMLAAFSLAQRAGSAVGSKIPFIDTTPNSPWQSAPTAANANQKQYIG